MTHPTPRTVHPERVRDAIDALLDSQDLLIVLEAAITTFIERNPSADAQIAGDHLVRIVRGRISETIDILFDVQGVMERGN
jgi:hypothetical protein